MRKYIPHIFVAATLHIVALMVAHKIAVEIVELIRDELYVTVVEHVASLVY